MNKVLRPAAPEYETLRRAFYEEYVGSAATRLHRFLVRCCNSYLQRRSGVVAPYISLVQSSGFGKSRLLRELALKTASDANIRVAYTCHQQSRYPRVTNSLWLARHSSPNQTEALRVCVVRLMATFDRAVENWGKISHLWIDFFHSSDALMGDPRIDYHDPNKNPNAESKPVSGAKVVVVALDEAQVLKQLERKEYLPNFLCLFLRSLNIPNAKIRQRYGPSACLFAILAATNPKIGLPDPSLRRENAKMFPPFVLTETSDIYHKQQMKQSGKLDLEFFQDLALNGTWNDLVKMGRPLWQTLGLEKAKLVEFAASTLLSGKSPFGRKSLDEKTMFGIASVFCRLGVVPPIWSPRFVTEFMAVLQNVTYTPDGHQHRSTYASDPILTFGASHVWYETYPDCLSDRILPEFSKMLAYDKLMIGEMGLVVARLILLLAMDACKSAVTPGCKSHVYTGETYRVATFLRVLRGPHVGFQWPKRSTGTCEELDDLRHTIAAKWKDWFIGFSQFVPFSCEPTELHLWSMLARRTAGIFSEPQCGADLLIPIFNPSTHRLSMILIHVKRQSGDGKTFPGYVSQQLDPKNVFPEESPFHALARSDVIRVCMNPRKVQPRRFYRIDSKKAPDNQNESEKLTTKEDHFDVDSNLLCLAGIAEWKGEGDSELIEFVSSDIAEHLVALLS